MQGSGRSMIHAGDGFLLLAEAIVEKVQKPGSRIMRFFIHITILLGCIVESEGPCSSRVSGAHFCLRSLVSFCLCMLG